MRQEKRKDRVRRVLITFQREKKKEKEETRTDEERR